VYGYGKHLMDRTEFEELAFRGVNPYLGEACGGEKREEEGLGYSLVVGFSLLFSPFQPNIP